MIELTCAPVNALTGGSKETTVVIVESKIAFEVLFSFHRQSFLPAFETFQGLRLYRNLAHCMIGPAAFKLQ